jgi:LysR family transcriptional activator of nhaA
MNYKHLHYFLQVAETGSVAAASRQLHLTPADHQRADPVAG